MDPVPWHSGEATGTGTLLVLEVRRCFRDNPGGARAGGVGHGIPSHVPPRFGESLALCHEWRVGGKCVPWPALRFLFIFCFSCFRVHVNCIVWREELSLC